MTRDDALAVLESGRFEGFINVAEDVEVEFKRAPYRLDEDGERFELAKDASALANARGGVIVIGVQTERRAEAAVDIVVRLRPVARGLVDETRYVDVITERVYPRLRELRVAFFPQADDNERGLVAVDVPPQAEVDKYFLVQRPVGGEGRTPGWLIGIAVRSVGRIDEQRIGEVHTLINRGLTVGRDLGDIAAAIAALPDAIAQGGGAAERADTAADRLEGVIAARLAELEA